MSKEIQHQITGDGYIEWTPVKAKQDMPPPPMECKTDAEKIAYAYGWFKALELNPARKLWVGLTDEELKPIADAYRILFGGWVEEFARAIEAKLKEKNT